MLELGQLGSRICIIGNSSCGKSTLAVRLAAKLNVPVYHLDLLAHLPNSKWQRTPLSEFVVKHAKIIQQDAWVIEGNYSVCMEERFARATAIIWLDMNVLGAAWRYLKRSLQKDPARAGGLPGGTTELRWFMLKQILWVQPSHRAKYQRLVSQYPLPCLSPKNLRELNHCYESWLL